MRKKLAVLGLAILAGMSSGGSYQTKVYQFPMPCCPPPESCCTCMGLECCPCNGSGVRAEGKKHCPPRSQRCRR